MHIVPNLPRFRNYYEPFVGGGSVFMSVPAERWFINDASGELMALYRQIAEGNAGFYVWAEAICAAWEETLAFAGDNPALWACYRAAREGGERRAAGVARLFRSRGDAMLFRTSPVAFPAFGFGGVCARGAGLFCA